MWQGFTFLFSLHRNCKHWINAFCHFCQIFVMTFYVKISFFTILKIFVLLYLLKQYLQKPKFGYNPVQKSSDLIKKQCYIYTIYTLTYLKEKTNFKFVVIWMKLEGIILSEISQEEKHKYKIISLICGI